VQRLDVVAAERQRRQPSVRPHTDRDQRRAASHALRAQQIDEPPRCQDGIVGIHESLGALEVGRGLGHEMLIRVRRSKPGVRREVAFGRRQEHEVAIRRAQYVSLGRADDAFRRLVDANQDVVEQ
jgi:hypothetical protein